MRAEFKPRRRRPYVTPLAALLALGIGAFVLLHLTLRDRIAKSRTTAIAAVDSATATADGIANSAANAANATAFATAATSAATAASTSAAAYAAATATATAAAAAANATDAPCSSDAKIGCMPRPALLIMSHNKPLLLKRSLAAICELELIDRFSVYVSEDAGLATLVSEATTSRCVKEVLHFQQPPAQPKTFEAGGLALIAKHFGAALQAVLGDRGHSHAVVLEDDLLVSRDFLRFFWEVAWLIERDPSLWCASAWNDQGFSHTISGDVAALRRTDYFPGLGWMITAAVWRELQPRWPKRATTGWDHWMRVPTTSRGRECVVPEVPRTHHKPIGRGTNVINNAAFERFAFEQTGVAAAEGFGDVSYLLEPAYESSMATLVRAASLGNFSPPELPGNPKKAAAMGTHKAWVETLPPGSTTLLLYVREGYKRLATPLGLWPESPRGTRGGLIAVHTPAGATLLLADQRKCELLSEEHRVRPVEPHRDGTASAGVSCTQHCAGLGLTCVQSELEWVNSCDVLQRHFACEAGCGHQVGNELPAYAGVDSLDTFQQCLFTDIAVPTCEASFAKTSRLCRCVGGSAV